jgi:hypothetical protein
MLGNSSWIMHRGRTWDWATHPSRRAGSGSAGTGSRAATLEDAVIAVVFGGLLMLFSWVTVGLPPSALTTCPGIDGCAPVPSGEPAAWIEAPGTDEPRATP